MKNYFIFLLSLFTVGSCNKDNLKSKCEECLYSNYDCERAGGEIKWKVNGKSEVRSSGYFKANIGSVNSKQQHFDFGGEFLDCFGDFTGSTKSSDESFGVGIFRFYIGNLKTRDFCEKSKSIISTNFQDFMEITKYDGKNASGNFRLTERTGGATQCMPDEWIVVGTFSNIPVY